MVDLGVAMPRSRNCSLRRSLSRSLPSDPAAATAICHLPLSLHLNPGTETETETGTGRI
jgi:hypothetical protein